MSFFFFFIIGFMLGSLLLLVLFHNAIHSLLALIGVFICKTILLLTFQIEYLALIFFMIYVGAIVVLFLFVVMMLDIKVSSMVQTVQTPLSYNNLILFILLISFTIFCLEDIHLADYIFSMQKFFKNDKFFSFWVENYNFFEIIYQSIHLEVIGRVLFRYFLMSFLLAGLILLIAMIGAIVLSMDTSYLNRGKLQQPSLQSLKKPSIYWG